MPRSSTLRVLAASVLVAAAIALLLALRPGRRDIARPDPGASARETPSIRGEPAGTSVSSAEVSTPEPATEAESVEVRARPAGPPRLRITGRVLQPDGEPARWAQIEATLAASSPVRVAGSGPDITVHTAWAHTEDDGTFAVDGLLPSLYDITARHSSGQASVRFRAGASDVQVILKAGAFIKGTVALREGEPASGVTVRALGTEWPGGWGAMTDENGSFVLWVLPGVYDLEASGSTVQDTVAEAVRAGGAPVEIVVEEAIRLRGRVLTRGGAPLESVVVLVAREGQKAPRRSATDADGRFEVFCPWPGPYRVSTESFPPYAPAVVDPVDPEAGEVVIQLADAALLEVTVEDAATKMPLEDAETRVLVPPGSLRVGRGPNPRFALGAGKAIVEAGAPGYFTERLDDVALAPRPEPARLSFALRRAGWLSGTVQTDDGTPVGGARISLARQVGPPTLVGGEHQRAHHAGLFGGPVWTQADGAFRLSLEKTRAGHDYGLAVEHPDVFLESDVTVELADPSADVSGVEIPVRSAGRIAGTVRGPDGPIAGELVLCFTAGAGYHSETSTGSDGRFEIGGLKPGAFTLKVEAPGHALAWVGPIDVAAGATSEAKVELTLEAAIEGRVIDPVGKPIAGVVVATEWRKGEWKSSATARSDRDGAYRLGSLEPGAYTLRAERTGFATVLRRDVATDGSPADIVLVPSSQVEGRVTDIRMGQPVPKFTVRLLAARADLETHDPLPPRDFESGDGSYRIEGVPAGSYRLIVGADGYLEHESALEVPSGEPARRDVALDEGSAITGVVLGSNGQPIGKASVALLLLGEARQSPRTATTDEAGRFRVAGLVAGEYRLVVGHPRFRESIEPVRVRPRDEPAESVEVRLEARATRD